MGYYGVCIAMDFLVSQPDTILDTFNIFSIRTFRFMVTTRVAFFFLLQIREQPCNRLVARGLLK